MANRVVWGSHNMSDFLILTFFLLPSFKKNLGYENRLTLIIKIETNWMDSRSCFLFMFFILGFGGPLKFVWTVLQKLLNQKKTPAFWNFMFCFELHSSLPIFSFMHMYLRICFGYLQKSGWIVLSHGPNHLETRPFKK